MARELSRPWLERPAPTHPLLEQLADSRAFIGVQGPEEVLRVVFAAYRTASAGRDWDPSVGTTTLAAATVEACARLGRLLWQAGATDFEHCIQPGPVFHFDGGTIGLDLRFGDPDDDGRALEAIAEGFAELGCTLGGGDGAPIISGGSPRARPDFRSLAATARSVSLLLRGSVASTEKRAGCRWRL